MQTPPLPAEWISPLPDEAVAKPNVERNAGAILARVVDNGAPMGSWTGLPTAVAAPVSGALLGAGLGALYHGVKNRLLPWINDEPADEEKTLGGHTLAGALAGLGIGSVAAYKQSAAYNPNQDMGRLLVLILNERSMSEYQKQQAIDRLDNLSSQQVRQLTMSAAVGGLTGAALGALLGVGPVAGGLAGALGGHLLSRNSFTF